MTDLRTPAQESALAEHVAVTREANGKNGGEWATSHHKTVTDLRRELVTSAVIWEKAHRSYTDQYRAAVVGKSRDEINVPAASVPAAVRDASCSCLMAGSYAYTLAAVLKVAERDLGEDAARQLAWVTAEILINGDDSDENGDLLCIACGEVSAHKPDCADVPAQPDAAHPGPPATSTGGSDA